MPSYADEYAARHPEWQRRTDTGPVRLTISRGESYRGPDGQIRSGEFWEEEEIMDVVSSVDAETDSWQLEVQHSQDVSLVDTICERFGKGLEKKSAHLRGFSLLVLDTNVLLSTLPFLKTLVARCLDRNVFSLSNAAFLPSPIALIVPHIVLSELDNLKTSRQGNAAPKARAANTWLLSALQAQKRQMYDDNMDGASRRINIPESSWVLHVENTAHASAIGGALDLLTPDEQIVRLCVSLKKHSGYEVCLCSDDTNARTKAETDGLATYSFKEIVQGVSEDTEKLVSFVDDLIEQWQSQALGAVVEEEDDTTDKMEEDRDMVSAASSRTAHHIDNSIRKPNIISTGTTTQHSIFAAPAPSTHTRTTRSASRSTGTHIQGDKRHINKSIKRHHPHQYPNDKSTASSMWAI